MLNPLQSKNGQNYVVLDFDQVNEKGVKKLTDALIKEKRPVASIESTNRSYRKDGVATKKITFRFEDMQEMELQINDTGDISSVKLNKKQIPGPTAKNINELASYIAKAVKKAAPAFTKSLAQKLRRAVASNTAQKRPATRSNVQRLQESKSYVASLKTDLDELRSHVTKQETVRASLVSDIEKCRSRLAVEQALTKSLQTKITNLEAENV